MGVCPVCGSGNYSGMYGRCSTCELRERAVGERQKGVEKLTNQAKLTNIAKNDENFEVSETAAEKVTDQKRLADIALNAKHNPARLIAAKKLDDKKLAQEVIVSLAKSGYYPAFEEITDQDALTDIALNADRGDERVKAAKYLSNQELAQKIFADIALNKQESIPWRMTVAENMTDPELLQQVYADVALNGYDYEWQRMQAVDLLNDLELALQVYTEIYNDRESMYYCSRDIQDKIRELKERINNKTQHDDF